MRCNCNKNKRKAQAQVAGLEDTNWANLGFTLLGAAGGALVDGALGAIEKLDGKHGTKAIVKAAGSIALVAFVDGESATAAGGGMLAQTGVKYLQDADVLAGVGKVYTY